MTWGNMCSSSAPLGTRLNVGRVVRVGIDIDAGKSCVPDSADSDSVATVTPAGRV